MVWPYYISSAAISQVAVQELFLLVVVKVIQLQVVALYVATVRDDFY